DEDRAFEEVFADRRQDVVDELRSRVDRPDLAPGVRGIEVALDLAPPLVEPLRHRAAALATQHAAEAENARALSARRDRAAADLVARLDARHVSSSNRHALVRRDHDAGDRVDVRDDADPSDRLKLACSRDETAADVAVVRTQRVEDIIERQAVADEAVEVDDDVVLLALASPGVHLRDAGNRSKARLDHPVVERRQLLERLPLARDDVVKDLSEPGRDRSHLRWWSAFGELDGVEPLEDELARKPEIGLA